MPHTILLLGPTGSGKSTFLEKYCDKITNISSHKITSFTKIPMAFKLNQTQLIFVDTPGIFDTEGETQNIFDNLFAQCQYFNSINCVLLFLHFDNKYNENVQSAIGMYTQFLNTQQPRIILVLTGYIEEENWIEIERDLPTKLPPLITKVVRWYHKTPADFDKLINSMKEVLEKKEPLIETQSMQKILTMHSQIKMLVRDMKEMESNFAKNENRILKIKEYLREIEEKNKNNLVTVALVDEFQCIGITGNNTRCTRTKFCHWLQNYYLAEPNAHQRIMTMQIVNPKPTIDIDPRKLENLTIDETVPNRNTPAHPEVIDPKVLNIAITERTNISQRLEGIENLNTIKMIIFEIK